MKKERAKALDPHFPGEYSGGLQIEIIAILKDKYGSRLVDVVPTQASWWSLYGDRRTTSDIVDDIRKSLKQ